MILTKPPKSGREKVCEILFAVAAGICLLPLAYLAGKSLLGTVGMGMNNSYLEHPFFVRDALWQNLLLALGFLLAAFLLWWGARRLSYPTVLGLCLLCTAVAGAAFLISARSAPTNDSYIVTHAAYLASQGDYSALDTYYFRCFPFQLGYVLFTEGLFRLAIVDCGGVFAFLGGVNLLALLGTEALLSMTVRAATGRDSAGKTVSLFLLFCLQPVLFCTFLYGNIPAFAFAVAAVFFAVRLMQTDLARYGVGMALCMGVGVALKLNSVIVAVATGGVLLLNAIRKKRFFWLVYLAGMVAAVFAVQKLCILQYTWRCGVDFGPGIPMTGWLAMGLNESVIAPGWYNGAYTVTPFVGCGYDADAMREIARQEIAARLDVFRENPEYCKQFFTDKFLTQWNETTYQSLWNTQVRGVYGEGRGAFATFCLGEGAGGLARYMDLFAQLVFLLACGGVVRCILRREEEQGLLILPVTVLGGMLYHLLFEAKSQYALVYFILLTVMAAVAADWLFTYVYGRIPFFHREKQGKGENA